MRPKSSSVDYIELEQRFHELVFVVKNISIIHACTVVYYMKQDVMFWIKKMDSVK